MSVWTFVAPVALVVAIVITVSVLSGATSGSRTVTATSRSTSATSVQGTTRPSSSLKRRYYRVKAGDTFDSIEKRFALDAGALTALNPSVDPLTIQPGQRLRVR